MIPEQLLLFRPYDRHTASHSAPHSTKLISSNAPDFPPAVFHRYYEITLWRTPNHQPKPSILTFQTKPSETLIGERCQITARGRQRRFRNGGSALVKAAIFNLPGRNPLPARRPCGGHPTAEPKMLKKRGKRAPEVSSVLPRRPNVLRIPARDGGGGI